MKLYDCTPAPSPRRVRIFMTEKGLDIPLVQVDLRNNAHLSPEFRRINPLCEVPALELDDGSVITESVAICRYLEELHPDPPLCGRTARERAEIAMWDHRMEIEGFFPVAEALRNHAPGFVGRALSGPQGFEQIPALVERGRARVGLFFATLNDRLAQSAYVSGAAFGLADITAIVCVDFAGRVKLTPSENLIHLTRWYKIVSARPSMSA
ncbi:glutathione S-transferase family protein [Govanella unica]|uniref:Glutathione S-transferase family protein n=1 Tax=Govanella unica TaxID=2975056 RepID=A0A9X3TVK2_9PROT|nr:glutathione S-transferase family protein [Govania unica]MDA5192488.1 glutathione S-transferase family protein [Govania unica]